jgi:hypothetical protein
MTAERELARLERQVLGVRRVSGFLASVELLRRMLERESPDLIARVLQLTAPAIGRDLAAAMAVAFDLGALDATAIIGQRGAAAQRIPLSLVASARETERQIAAEIVKARKLARADADPATVMAPVQAAAVRMKRDVATLVNAAGNAGSTAAADAAGLATVWIAETNACVTCLAYSGEVADPGDAFPAGLSYGSSSSVSAPIPHPPAHPNCRCTVEPLRAPEYAAALRREADRSVLRGFSLESESMATRVRAAEQLLEDGVNAPASVIAYARRAVSAGEFPTRGRPGE